MNKYKKWLLFAILLILLVPTSVRAQLLKSSDGLTITNKAAWLDEAKFGLFIHFGLYSQMGKGEWIMCNDKIPKDEYIKLADTFNPVKFDANNWVAIAKNAGMKYITITSKHHDGFCLFDTDVDDYNVVDGTPFKRDILKELKEAADKEGIKLGFYYSQAQDWYHLGGSGRCSQKGGDFNKYINEVSIPQIKELLTKYDPSHLWFDTPHKMNESIGRQIVETVRAIKPNTIINSRLMYHGNQVTSLSKEKLKGLENIGVDFLSYKDRTIPEESTWDYWETCMTISSAWGYRETDHDWKTPETVIRQLVEVVSKGGAFLLNVGPTSDGLIAKEAQKTLKQVGDWLKINGEAIYGAKPTTLKGVHKEYVPTLEQLKKMKLLEKEANATGANLGAPKKKAAGHKKNIEYRWIATGKDKKVFIHLFEWPTEPLVIEDFDAKVSKAYFLADKSLKLKYKLSENKLEIKFPKNRVGDITSVICFELK